MNKCCYNCKYRKLFEDNFDENSDTGIGHRLLFDCGIVWYKRPLMLSVIERSCNDSMKVENSFLMTFYCCYYEDKSAR